jgi:class 3 adenylate cyclase
VEEALAAFEQAGHYEPEAPRARERRELIEHLIERFGLAPVLEAARRVPMFTVAVELSDPQPPRRTAREVASESGLTVAEVALVRAASGFPVPDPDVPWIPETAIADAVVAKAAFDLLGEERTLAFTRVIGAAVQQITDAARATFAGSLVETTRGPVTELELSVSNEVAWAVYSSLPEIVGNLIMQRADTRQDLVSRLVDGDLELAVVFVDLVGSTAWTATVDPHRYGAALARFEQAAWEAAITGGGRLVKLIGDEAMIVADDVESACEIAAAVCVHAQSDPDLPVARGAIAWGAVVARGGDYFGSVVNLAARLIGEAAPGEVVLSGPAAELVSGEQWRLEGKGDAELRGVPGPTPVFALKRPQE